MAGRGPSFDTWLDEIKGETGSSGIGMYLMHNGVVRGTARGGAPVTGMDLTYDEDRLAEALEAARSAPGIIAARAWINEGHLDVGDDIMRVLVAGDIRENVFAALQQLVGSLKTRCVHEKEIG
jgi:molybdopterin synthase catalytic subunit